MQQQVLDVLRIQHHWQRALRQQTHQRQHVDLNQVAFAGQFGDPRATALEIARILRPGARAVLTNWRPLRAGDEALPERVRDLDAPVH